jgi:hypothetical protein
VSQICFIFIYYWGCCVHCYLISKEILCVSFTYISRLFLKYLCYSYCYVIMLASHWSFSCLYRTLWKRWEPCLVLATFVCQPCYAICYNTIRLYNAIRKNSIFDSKTFNQILIIKIIWNTITVDQDYITIFEGMLCVLAYRFWIVSFWSNLIWEIKGSLLLLTSKVLVKVRLTFIVPFNVIKSITWISNVRCRNRGFIFNF